MATQGFVATFYLKPAVQYATLECSGQVPPRPQTAERTTMAYKSRRASADEVERSRVQGRKGLTADGSTRAWRKLRDSLPGKPKRCPDGRPPFVDHIVPRKDGGKDTPSNLRWRCGKNPNTGRPKGS